MAFTIKEALSKIGTEGYTGVDGLRRLVNETSAIAENAVSDATLLLYSKDVVGQLFDRNYSLIFTAIKNFPILKI